MCTCIASKCKMSFYTSFNVHVHHVCSTASTSRVFLSVRVPYNDYTQAFQEPQCLWSKGPKPHSHCHDKVKSGQEQVIESKNSNGVTGSNNNFFESSWKLNQIKSCPWTRSRGEAKNRGPYTSYKRLCISKLVSHISQIELRTRTIYLVTRSLETAPVCH